MGTSTKNLIFLTDTADVDCGFGVTCKMTFRPSAISTIASDAYQNESDIEALAEYLCSIITAWEMTGPVPVETIGTLAAGSLVADGQPVPLDPKTIMSLPFGLLQGILVGVSRAALPKFPTPTTPTNTTPAMPS